MSLLPTYQSLLNIKKQLINNWTGHHHQHYQAQPLLEEEWELMNTQLINAHYFDAIETNYWQHIKGILFYNIITFRYYEGYNSSISL